MTRETEAVPKESDFASATEPFRRELLAHCYRMLGSVDDAEDAVQETYLRAWRSYGTFEGRSSVRSWLYRIATNACLTALERRGRRALPSGLGGPSDAPEGPWPAASGVSWVQPMPDTLVAPESEDPAAVLTARESIRLALIASLQYLPPRQRAVLLLREVLAWSAAEVAASLDTSTAAVKSMLQRARARLEEVAPAADRIEEPAEAESRAQLDRYMAAFESADAAALESALREDAVIEMSGTRSWFEGLVTCIRFLVASGAMATPGAWRMLPTRANGQPAAAAYLRGEDGVHHAYGLAVLTTSAGGIARIAVFGEPALVARAGFPPMLASTPEPRP